MRMLCILGLVYAQSRKEVKTDRRGAGPEGVKSVIGMPSKLFLKCLEKAQEFSSQLSYFVCICIFLVLVLPVFGKPLRQPEERTREQIQTLIEEKLSRTPIQQKLSSQLLYELHRQHQTRFAPAVRSLRRPAFQQKDGQILIDINATVTPKLLKWIETHNGLVINSYANLNAIRA